MIRPSRLGAHAFVICALFLIQLFARELDNLYEAHVRLPSLLKSTQGYSALDYHSTFPPRSPYESVLVSETGDGDKYEYFINGLHIVATNHFRDGRLLWQELPVEGGVIIALIIAISGTCFMAAIFWMGASGRYKQYGIRAPLTLIGLPSFLFAYGILLLAGTIVAVSINKMISTQGSPLLDFRIMTAVAAIALSVGLYRTPLIRRYKSKS